MVVGKLGVKHGEKQGTLLGAGTEKGSRILTGRRTILLLGGTSRQENYQTTPDPQSPTWGG